MAKKKRVITKWENQIYLTLFIILMLLLFVVVILFFAADKKNDTSTFLYTTDFNPGRKVVIKSILPVSDTMGKNFDGTGTKEGVQGYTEITIKNIDEKVHNYNIIVSRIEDTSQIKEGYVRFYLTDYNNNPLSGFNGLKVPSYGMFEECEAKQGYRILATISLEPGEEKIYKLKSWLSENYVVSLNTLQFEYSIDVVEKC